MAKNDQIVGPYWTKHWIEKMWRYTSEKFVDFDTGAVDFEALGREEYEFRKALFYRNFKNSPRAKEAFEETAAGYKTYVENGKKGGRPRKNQETTADGDIREDSQDIATSGNGSVTESGTSANIYGVAPHREAVDVSATDSKNMRRVPQNEAPAHGFSGGRTAQGTMSRSPEAAAQSGKAYDQETDQVSTNGPRQAEARQSRRAGGNSLRVAKVSTPPARSSGRRIPHPQGSFEVFDFAQDNGIPDYVANEFYQRFFAERPGTDMEGKNIDNWKGALVNYNKSKKKESA